MNPDNNNIKHREAEQLKGYLATISYKERVDFVTDVVTAFGVRRSTFANWKSMACRIPSEAKEIIESVAGCVIFYDNQ